MLEQQSGVIVNLASIGGRVALRCLATYCVSKAGLVSLTQVLAVKWAGRGVWVNAVVPAYVGTSMAEPLMGHPILGPQLIARIPLGRPAEAAEVARAVPYLASDDVSYVQGHVL